MGRINQPDTRSRSKPKVKPQLLIPSFNRILPKPKPKPIMPQSPPSPTQPKKLLIGTVFINLRDENSLKWLDLQLKYFESTTKDFDHITYVHEAPDEIPGMFSGRTQILTNKQDERTNLSSPGHIKGLENLLTHFKSCRGNYTYFLFIDMDAFPIKKDWMDLLLAKMSNKYEISTILRCENLETRLHSSVLFATNKSLDLLRWDVGNVGQDLLGDLEKDVKIIDYQEKYREKSFVMLRSNKFQVHPLMCGVYYDMFYHHACGSGRKYNMRGMHYWNDVYSEDVDPEEWTRMLFDNPNEFIGNLAGWKPLLYGSGK